MPDSERKIPKLRSINKERERAITMLVVFGMFVLVVSDEEWRVHKNESNL